MRRIEGRVIGHEGLFAGERRGEDWAWGDLVWCYGAEVSALSFNDNCVDLTVAPGEREGDAVVIGGLAAVELLPGRLHRHHRRPRGAPGELRLERDLGGNVIRISGTHAIGQRPWKGSVALEDPARYAATVFTRGAGAKGIVGDRRSRHAVGAAARDAARRWPPWRACRSRSSSRSSTRRARTCTPRCCCRLLGARRGGVGTQESGAEAVDEFLQRMGVRTEAWQLQDASGLSRSDLLIAARDGHAAGGHGSPSPRRGLPGQPARGRGGRHAGLADEGHGRGRARAGQDGHHRAT